MKIIINLFIIVLVYCLPYVYYLYNMNLNSDSFKNFSLKNIIFLMFYSLTILYLPPIFKNTLPFIIVVITILNMKNNNDADYTFYKFNKFEISQALEYASVGFLISIGASIIWTAILSLLKVNLEQQQVVSMLLDTNIISFIISIVPIVIFAPILEEFVYRFILFEKIFSKFLPKIIAATIVSLVFSLMHFNLSGFLDMFAISMVSSYLIEKKGFWYSVSLHILSNSLAVIALLIGRIV